MKYKLLDLVLREICAITGDFWMHRYVEYYNHAMSFLRSLDIDISGTKAFTRVPVINRVAWLPPDMMSNPNIGVEVNGSLSLLQPNPQMLFDFDNCGDISPPVTGNPDVPYFSVEPGESRWVDNIPNFYWPGYGGGHSIYGYYRIFPDRGCVVLSEGFQHSHLVIEYSTSSFVPGKRTFVSEFAVEAIRAHIVYECNLVEANVASASRSMLAVNKAERNAKMNIFRHRSMSAPLHIVIAALRTGYGGYPKY
jgi:hypothetical protein